jgi:hypothetical protein
MVLGRGDGRLNECSRGDVDEIAITWDKPYRTVTVTAALNTVGCAFIMSSYRT